MSMITLICLSSTNSIFPFLFYQLPFSMTLLCTPYTAGQNSSLAELTDFICAAQMAKATDAHLSELLPEDKVIYLVSLSGNNHPPKKGWI